MSSKKPSSSSSSSSSGKKTGVNGHMPKLSVSFSPASSSASGSASGSFAPAGAGSGSSSMTTPPQSPRGRSRTTKSASTSKKQQSSSSSSSKGVLLLGDGSRPRSRSGSRPRSRSASRGPSSSEKEKEKEKEITKTKKEKSRGSGEEGEGAATSMAAAGYEKSTVGESFFRGTVQRTREKRVDAAVVYEFGGPLGVSLIMLAAPLLMFYLWSCLEYHRGKLYLPLPPQWGGSDEAVGILTKAWAGAAPTWYATKIYVAFNVFQALLGAYLPGPVIMGLPVPALNNRQLEYLCNGVTSWYVTMATAAALHLSGWFPLTEIVDHFGPIMTVSILAGNVASIYTYAYTVLVGEPHRMSGNLLYDLFMGAPLNPRLGRLDFKMWAEIRIPWTMLFFITLSAALKEYQLYGNVSPPMWFMLVAHWLYVNACMKGEECIPTTWDIFYEKWGYMLIFWNLSGVSFSYCYSTLYLLNYPKWHGGSRMEHWWPYTIACFAMLLVGYYIWDTANSQRTRFRMKIRGTYIKRYTFPQLPWGTLPDDAKCIVTKHGERLLVDGWWQYVRKPNYTADLMMALSWGLICGFDSVIPYFYVAFFVGVLVHRTTRDMHRCAQKYDKDWDEYCSRVPYVFIPYVY